MLRFVRSVFGVGVDTYFILYLNQSVLGEGTIVSHARVFAANVLDELCIEESFGE